MFLGNVGKIGVVFHGLIARKRPWRGLSIVFSRICSYLWFGLGDALFSSMNFRKSAACSSTVTPSWNEDAQPLFATGDFFCGLILLSIDSAAKDLLHHSIEYFRFPRSISERNGAEHPRRFASVRRDTLLDSLAERMDPPTSRSIALCFFLHSFLRLSASLRRRASRGRSTAGTLVVLTVSAVSGSCCLYMVFCAGVRRCLCCIVLILPHLLKPVPHGHLLRPALLDALDAG